MAERIARSMNAEMFEGSVDGTYKRIAPNRTNIEFPDIEKIREEREDLSWPEGVEETNHKVTPDGRFVRHSRY